MGRHLRHIRPGGAIFEITTRCLQSRFLLPAGEHFRSIAIGIIARAQQRHPVEIYAFGGLLNHLHFLLGAANVKDLSGFMEYVNGNLAREAHRLVDWPEKFWGRRFRAIEVSSEEEAMVSRLRYVISHGPKESLVLRCREWPGLQCIEALTQGKPLEGIWRDRSLEYEANRRDQEVDSETFTKRHTLRLDPLPCWRHLSSDEIRLRLTEMVAEIDAESARRVVLGGSVPLGAAVIRKQHPHKRPARSKKSPAPAVHAASREVRKQLKEAYRLFVEAYQQAAVRLRAGDYSVEFPPSCFPSPRPCVSSDFEQPGSRAGPVRVPG